MDSTKQEEIQIPEIQDYCNHLVEICKAFNQEAGLFNIPARLDPSKAVIAVQSGTDTNETIPRTEAGKRREGACRVKQVALPNRVAIRQRVNNAGNMVRVFPVPYSPYDDRHMTDDERVVREGS